MISAELVGAVFTGLVALIGAIAAATARRSQRLGGDVRELRREARELRDQQQLADRYIGRLVRLLNVRGIPIPAPPDGLFEDGVLDDPDARNHGDPAGDDDAAARRGGGAHRTRP